MKSGLHAGAAVMVALACNPVKAEFNDSRWFRLGGGYGVNNLICAVAADASSNLYVGGNFTMAGDIMASRIALWTPTNRTWHALGEGVDDHVYAIVIASNGLIYAGGDFSNAGSVAASGVAVWESTSQTWSNLGAGVNGRVYGMALDDAGRLVAGGDFTTAGGQPAKYIAMWDPTTGSWTNLGSGMDDAVYTLCPDGSGGLYAGGWFTMADGNPASHVAHWDGTAWSALGSGTDDAVAALTMGPSNQLFVGGYFAVAGGINSRGVAMWNGVAWSNMTLGLSCFVLALDYEPSEDALYAAGWISCASSDNSSSLVRWKNGAWSPCATLNDMIVSIDVMPGGCYLGGFFTTADQTDNCHSVVFINANGPHPMGQGMDNVVDALALDGLGRLYVGGWFRTVDSNTDCVYVARYDRSGGSWTNLGDGLPDGVLALAVDSSNRLYAGGVFLSADGNTNARHVAMWDPATESWTNLGAGFNGHVHQLLYDHDGFLLAGGMFTASGSTSLPHIARWDGNTWTGLGTGLPGSGSYYGIQAMAIDASNRLYVGGWFTNSGGNQAVNIAMWDPGSQAWTNLGIGISDRQEVYALAVDANGRVAVGGCFTNAGGVGTSHIAWWDPAVAAWTNLGEGVNCVVKAITFDDDGNLYAGGGFTAAGGQPAYGVAKWNGNEWEPMGSGIDGQSYALLEDGTGQLYVGGDFRTAGNLNSSYLAMAVLDTADSDADGLPDWWELDYFAGRTNGVPGSIAANGRDTVWESYVADISPVDPGSEIPQPFMMLSGGLPGVMIDSSSAARRYRVLTCTDLLGMPQVWHTHGTAVHGTGSALQLAVPDQAGALLVRTVIELP